MEYLINNFNNILGDQNNFEMALFALLDFGNNILLANL